MVHIADRARCVVIAIAAFVAAVASPGGADEAPIAGSVKSIDAAAGTLVIESASKGKLRQVTVHVRSDAKIVRFHRSTDPGKPGFSEHPASLADLKPGWTVSVKTRHDGDKEVAELVRVVHEK